MEAIGELAGAGWYPSPDGRGQRWWDGMRWTDQWMPGARSQTLADGRSPGARLRDALAAGWRPEPRPAAIAVSSMEQVYAHAAVEIVQLGGCEPGGFIGSQPAEDAAPGWQRVDHGTVHLTSFRFALQLAQQFANIPYVAVVDSSCEDDGIVIWQSNRAPVKLRLVDPEWHFVLFRWLAFGEPRNAG